MICNLPEILVIKLAFHLADRLTREHLARVHRRDYALECRQLIWAAPESQRRFVIGYLRKGVLLARRERIERMKFAARLLGPAPVSTELAARSGHAVDAPLATLNPEAKHQLTKTSLGTSR